MFVCITDGELVVNSTTVSSLLLLTCITRLSLLLTCIVVHTLDFYGDKSLWLTSKLSKHFMLPKLV